MTHQLLSIIYRWHQYGRRLIPCAGKAPAVSGWTSPDYAHDLEALRRHVIAGGAVGWAICAGCMVLDVDPRNGGKASLAALAAEYQKREGARISDVHPIITTGGGGWHIYGALPSDVEPSTLAATIADGVEVKRVGHQVIIPGSPHPSGLAYAYRQTAAPDAAELAPWPRWLIERAVRKPGAASRPRDERAWSGDELAGWLEQLDPEAHREHGAWLSLLLASHEATGGSVEGREAFAAWSAGDPEYTSRGAEVRARWDGTRNDDSDGAVTRATLIAAVHAAGGSDPSARADVEALDELPPLSDDERLPSPAERVEAASAAARAAVDALPTAREAITDDALAPVLVALSRLRPLEQERLVIEVAKRMGVRPSAVRKSMERSARTEGQREIDDAAFEIAAGIRSDARLGRLMMESSGRIWLFAPGAPCWREMTPPVLAGHILSAVGRYARRHPEYSGSLSALCSQTDILLRGMIVKDESIYLLGAAVAHTAAAQLVPARTATLVVRPETARIEAVQAAAEHYQTWALSAAYDPTAECPRFARALSEILSDDAEVVRHVWELLGYTIQPRKDLPAWVLLVGKGANGKSVLLDVLTALLGQRAACLSLHELDVAKDAHAMADLAGRYALIDDDLDASQPLPDAQIKRLSENKMITANPKHRARFEFENTAICWAACNAMPRSGDASDGLYRRAHVIQFARVFAPEEQDIRLGGYIRERELSGVLRYALEGLLRLRARGRWELPRSMVKAANEWRAGASVFAAWWFARVEAVRGMSLPMAEAWADYRAWALDNGITKGMARHTFEGLVAQQGSYIRGEALMGYALRTARNVAALGLDDY